MSKSFIRKCVLECFVLSLFAVVVFAQTPTPTPPNEQLVKVEYDASKNFTQISLNPIVLASRRQEELRLAATTGYPGKTRTKPTEITLILFSLSHVDENNYGATHKLSAVADGHRFDWGETSHAKQATNGVFIEVMNHHARDQHHLGREAQRVVTEVVGQELVRPARRETDAQRDRDVAPLSASLRGLRADEECLLRVRPASASPCFKRARKIQTCRSSAVASSGALCARTPSACAARSSAARTPSDVRRIAFCASASIAAPPQS